MMFTNFDSQTPHLDDLPAMMALWRERMMIISQSTPHLRRHIQAETDHIAQLTTWLSDERVKMVCAKQNNILIGYMVCLWRDNIPLISDMALDAHTYHRGLAKGLFSDLQTHFIGTTSQPIIIRVARYYAVEQAFWRGLGATEWTNQTWEINPLYQWMRLSSVPPTKPI